MLKVVKIGGNIVDDTAKLQAFLAGFAGLEGPKILVHGGGKIATDISKALRIQTVMVDGRRITDSETLEVVTMVYNGINKQIVSMLQGLGCNSVGLCGADGRLIVSKKRPSEPINYGYVGDPVCANTLLADTLIEQGFTLVIAPITCECPDVARGCGPRIDSEWSNVGAGASMAGLLNTNADTVAQFLATSMASPATAPDGKRDGNRDGNNSNVGNEDNVGSRDVELVYCFEKKGVLADVDNDESVIPHIDTQKFAELKAAGAVHSGMLPKLENAFEALEGGVKKVVICAAENIGRPGYGGTVVTK